MANPRPSDSLLADRNSKPLLTARQTHVNPVVTMTYTSGSAPAVTGALTVANSATPTVVELLKYCTELQAKLTAINTILESHGLSADA
jgi:hypothetical protein